MDHNCPFPKMPLRFACLLSFSTFWFLVWSSCLELGRFPNTINPLTAFMHVLREIKSFGLVNSGIHLSGPAEKQAQGLLAFLWGGAVVRGLPPPRTVRPWRLAELVSVGTTWADILKAPIRYDWDIAGTVCHSFLPGWNPSLGMVVGGAIWWSPGPNLEVCRIPDFIPVSARCSKEEVRLWESQMSHS